MLRRLIVSSLIVGLASVSVAQERVKDVIYAKRGGYALTMDVFKPAKPNGLGVIWLVSGGWFSNHDMITPAFAKGLNDAGFTVFEVVHGSQPKFQIPEIVNQVQQAVRYIRVNAKTFGVDAERLGMTGSSAGGHLSLMVGGLADPGKADGKDDVEKAPATVKAIVAYYPPSNFESFGSAGDAFKDPKLAVFLPAWGITRDTPAEKVAELAKATSPIRLVNKNFPATLVIHGDKDMLVPVSQSYALDKAFETAGSVHKLIIVPGGGHDANTIIKTYADLVAWFTAKLRD